MKKRDRIYVDWGDSTQYSEYSWHQLSPYIGKMKSSMARNLVTNFTREGDIIYDPFCGAGTVALEGWIAGRNVISGDISPYAFVLSKAKLMPPKTLGEALARLDKHWGQACRENKKIDLRRVPKWVRTFFHPETLRETIAVCDGFIRHRQWFLLSCLLGILHHWRPGFLSYPCSHTVPYLKDKIYPRTLFPEMYERRDVYVRLAAKVRRAYARIPNVDHKLIRKVKKVDAKKHLPDIPIGGVSAIITSPPYMNSLSYARDNRLRLWFLGINNHRKLEPKVSPRKKEFLGMMQKLFHKWSKLLKKDGVCVLILGAVRQGGKFHDLPQEIADLVNNMQCSLYTTEVCKNVIPDIRRARFNCRATREETIIVLRKREK